MIKRTRRATVSAMTLAAALAAAGSMTAAATPAAADEELADLKAKVADLEKRIEAREAAAYVKPGKNVVSLEVSGQVNKMFLYADDGDQGRGFIADNDESSTRVRWVGKAKMDDVTAGARVEVQFESNSSADITIDQDRAVGTNNFTERKLEIWFKHADLGQLSLGQGDTASNGVAEEDLSGTVLTGDSAAASLGESFAFVLDGTSTPSGTTVGDVLDNQDGLSRQDRIRYDTPSLAGFQLSTSFIDGDDWDVAARYGREFDGFEVAVAAAFWDTQSLEGYGGSGSVLAPFGTNLTLAYTVEERDAAGSNETSFYYAKLGQQLDVTSLGTTALAIDVAHTEDQDGVGNEGMTYGFGAVQKIKSLSTEAYFGVRRFEADLAADVEAVDIVFAGARVKF